MSAERVVDYSYKAKSLRSKAEEYRTIGDSFGPFTTPDAVEASTYAKAMLRQAAESLEHEANIFERLAAKQGRSCRGS